MSALLNVVQPFAITPEMIVEAGTNVPEADYPAWVAGTTYATGVRVILVATHTVYESVIAGNIGKNPATDRTAWLVVSPTNRWRAFDRANSTQTQQATYIKYTLRVGRAVPSVNALNLTGATAIRVRVIDPTYGTVYDRTTSLSAVPVAVGWWNWAFGERRTPRQQIAADLPSFPSADIVIELWGGANLAVGVLLLGRLRTFGVGVKSGASLGIQDYSRKERNTFGDTLLVEGAFAKRAGLRLLLTADEVDALYSFLADVRATPCLWIGSQQYESTTVYGFYRSFDIAITYATFSDCDLELEGMT